MTTPLNPNDLPLFKPRRTQYQVVMTLRELTDEELARAGAGKLTERVVELHGALWAVEYEEWGAARLVTKQEGGTP